MSRCQHAVRIDLTPQQYDELVQLSGQPARQFLENYVNSPEWRSMSDPQRVDFVKSTLKEFRKAGRETLKGRYPELAAGWLPRTLTQALR